ncbi:MAG TPA: phenylalanine--tRNA ligase subunit alpha [Polyangiaceae bacterium]|nr:phenylalanine--tRNA ligase subunit alpha [Polyangiaceae bacterium]
MTGDPLSDVETGLREFGVEYRERFAAATTEQSLRLVRAEILGKKGTLTRVLRVMGNLPPAERPRVGERVNLARAEVESAFSAKLEELRRHARNADLGAAPYDLTLPGRMPVGRGHRHPVVAVRDEILEIFRSLGFTIAWGPEVELEQNNFTKLAFPADHPAIDMQDTFWVRVLGGVESARTLLRTHTSNVQVREMTTHCPPLAVVSGGSVYRRDDDVTHSPMFHQIEGFLVGQTISFSELKGVLTEFIHRLYGEKQVRFRPSYFPFVEPGAEVDVACVFCGDGTGIGRDSCRVCKATGWLEILGCGMVHPRVLELCGIDPERHTGFAFGMGIERVAMLRYGIPDIRLLFENDPRFLAQF